MAQLSGSRITVDLPEGWDGEIYQPAAVLQGVGGAGHSVVHAANFPLPAERGDFGSGAVEIMGDGDVLIVLFEYGPESAGTALFSHRGLPGSLRSQDFHPDTMQRPLPGQSGVQRFFTAEGRAFCLYVAVGNHVDRHEVLEAVNGVIAGIEIDP